MTDIHNLWPGFHGRLTVPSEADSLGRWEQGRRNSRKRIPSLPPCQPLLGLQVPHQDCLPQGCPGPHPALTMTSVLQRAAPAHPPTRATALLPALQNYHPCSVRDLHVTLNFFQTLTLPSFHSTRRLCRPFPLLEYCPPVLLTCSLLSILQVSAETSFALGTFSDP